MSIYKQPDYENGCKFKMRHATRHAAEGQAHKRGHNRMSKKRLAAYHCVFCGGWHVGKQRGRGGTKLMPYLKKYRKGVEPN